MKEKLSVCFTARPCHDVFSSRLYLSIKENIDKDIVGHFITSNKKETDFIVQKLGKEVYVHEVSSYFREHWDEFTLEDLEKNEELFDAKPIWKYIYADRFLINEPYDYCVKIADGYFHFWNDVFKDSGIDYYYDEAVSTLQTYIGYLVSKKTGVTYISQFPARGGLDNKLHYYVYEPYELNLDLDDDYLSKNYSEEEIKRADEYLTENENKEIKPQNESLLQSEPKLNIPYFLTKPLHVLKARKNPANSDRYFYMYYHHIEEAATEQIRYYFNYQKGKKYYQQPDYNRKYVYFPLHYQPEASTIVCAQKYEKQLFFIDSFAKSLPADTVLYVKEHYSLLGQRDPKFYEDLKQYPNVFLINPFISSRELILHSEAVTTLTGTAGWEALLLRKPVFLAGRIFFENAPGVIKTDEVFGNYVREMDKWKKPDRDVLIKYLCSYFRSLYPGNAFPYGPSLEKENLDMVAKSLYDKMIEIKENRPSKLC